MQAIIMAAGRGSRLGELTKDKPKAFIEIKGIKLIEYNIALLHAFGITDITIVTGYLCEQYEELAAKIKGVHCVYNPFYEMMNVLGSFYMAQEVLTEDFIYIHADTLCAPEIMKELIETTGDIVLPVDYSSIDEEAMKILRENGEIVQISKRIPLEKAEGEFIGIAKISGSIIPDLKQAVKDVLKEKEFQEYFEAALQKLMDQKCHLIKVMNTDNLFWSEVDFQEDYEKATRNIPEQLVKIACEEF